MSEKQKSLEELSEVVAPNVLLNAIKTSQKLAALGIPHALIGGLAVGLHGHPRATKDVDFIVGNEAYKTIEPFLIFREELKDIAEVGVIDFLYPPKGRESLISLLTLPKGNEIPVISVPALILLKLDAKRSQDYTDIHALLKAGADVAEITSFLKEHAPEHLTKFAEILTSLDA